MMIVDCKSLATLKTKLEKKLLTLEANYSKLTLFHGRHRVAGTGIFDTGHIKIKAFVPHTAVIWSQGFVAADPFSSALRGVTCWPKFDIS